MAKQSSGRPNVCRVLKKLGIDPTRIHDVGELTFEPTNGDNTIVHLTVRAILPRAAADELIYACATDGINVKTGVI